MHYKQEQTKKPTLVVLGNKTIYLMFSFALCVCSDSASCDPLKCVHSKPIYIKINFNLVGHKSFYLPVVECMSAKN